MLDEALMMSYQLNTVLLSATRKLCECFMCLRLDHSEVADGGRLFG